MNNEDKKKVTRRLILVCWIVLFICLIIKLCGGNYFEIMSNNETFINVCNYIDNSYLKYVIRFIFANFSFYLYISSIVGRNLKLKEIIFSETFIIIDIILKYRNYTLGFIMDCIILLAIPFLIMDKNKYRILIGFVFINTFQLISLLTRNIGIKILNNSILTELIIQVDYYIMLILYYLYSVKMKGECIMGQIGWLWFGSNVAMDKGYQKFLKAMSVIGVILTFPISVPYILWKKHKSNKMVKVDK